jgi:hypothetical protein
MHRWAWRLTALCHSEKREFGGALKAGEPRYLFTAENIAEPAVAGGDRLQELETLLAMSRAHETFKSDVRAFCVSGHAPRIRVDSYVPQVKVQRLLKHMLATEPDLPIQGVTVSGEAGCSDFVGTVEAQTHAATRVFEFAWCCRWRAEQEGWTDFFGFPDQMRAAQEFDWRCFHTWRELGARY